MKKITGFVTDKCTRCGNVARWENSHPKTLIENHGNAPCSVCGQQAWKTITLAEQ